MSYLCKMCKNMVLETPPLDKFFSKKEVLFKNLKIYLYAPKNNYQLDKYCENYFKKYSRNPYFINFWYSTDSLNRYLFSNFIDLFAGKKILELGGGNGLTSILLSKYDINITVIDYEIESCKLINKNKFINKCNFNVIAQDWNSPCFKNTFDYIVGSDIIYDNDNIQNLSNILNRLLSKQGKIIIANFENPSLNLFLNSIKNKFIVVNKIKTDFCQKKIFILELKKIND